MFSSWSGWREGERRRRYSQGTEAFMEVTKKRPCKSLSRMKEWLSRKVMYKTVKKKFFPFYLFNCTQSPISMAQRFQEWCHSHQLSPAMSTLLIVLSLFFDQTSAVWGICPLRSCEEADSLNWCRHASEYINGLMMLHPGHFHLTGKPPRELIF